MEVGSLPSTSAAALTNLHCSLVDQVPLPSAVAITAPSWPEEQPPPPASDQKYPPPPPPAASGDAQEKPPCRGEQEKAPKENKGKSKKGHAPNQCEYSCHVLV